MMNLFYCQVFDVDRNAVGKRIARLVCFLSSLWLSGCSTAPAYVVPDVPMPAKFKEGIQWIAANEQQNVQLPSAWWRLYKDSELDTMEEEALASNSAIAAAGAVVAQASAALAESKSSLWPTVSLVGSTSRQREGFFKPSGARIFSRLQDKTFAGIDVSWEPDFWSLKRSGIASDRALAEADFAQRYGVQLSVSALVAAHYFALRQADVMLALRQQALDIEKKLGRIKFADMHHGRSSSDDYLRTATLADAQEVQLASLRRTRANSEHALAVLMGKAPAEFSLPAHPTHDVASVPLPDMLPSQLLQRRPDIVQAERRVAAASAKIGVAQAAFYPAISLTGTDGAHGVSLRRLVDLPSHFWTIGAFAVETVFDSGRRRAVVDKARARYDEEVAHYRTTVLTAFREVEDTLSDQRLLQERNASLKRILETSRKLAESQRKRQTLGLASTREVLIAKKDMLEVELAWRSGTAETEQNGVLLIKSLGGGWEAVKADVTHSDLETVQAQSDEK